MLSPKLGVTLELAVVCWLWQSAWGIRPDSWVGIRLHLFIGKQVARFIGWLRDGGILVRCEVEYS
jgi:hypothetical protein